MRGDSVLSKDPVFEVPELEFRTHECKTHELMNKK